MWKTTDINHPDNWDKEQARFFSKIKIVNQCWISSIPIYLAISDNPSPGYKGKQIQSIYSNGATVRLERFVYERFIGELPMQSSISKSCGNELCCNPDHFVYNGNRTRMSMIDPIIRAQIEAEFKLFLIGEKSRFVYSHIAKKYNVANQTVNRILIEAGIYKTPTEIKAITNERKKSTSHLP